MTETELKRIEYMIRVMSSHQVTNNKLECNMVAMRIKQQYPMGEQDSSIFIVDSNSQAKIHGNGWEPQLTWEPVLWAQVSFQ